MYPNACVTETVSPDTTLGPFDYIIGSGVLNIEPTWTSSVTAWTCPAQFKIYYDDNGVYTEPLTTDQLGVLTFFTANGFLDVETVDLAYDQTTWTIYLTKESIYSTEP